MHLTRIHLPLLNIVQLLDSVMQTIVFDVPTSTARFLSLIVPVLIERNLIYRVRLQYTEFFSILIIVFFFKFCPVFGGAIYEHV